MKTLIGQKFIDKIEDLKHYTKTTIDDIQTCCCPMTKRVFLNQQGFYWYKGHKYQAWQSNTSVYAVNDVPYCFDNYTHNTAFGGEDAENIEFTGNMEQLVNEGKVWPFLLFVNGVVIPWSKMVIIKDYDYSYIMLKNDTIVSGYYNNADEQFYYDSEFGNIVTPERNITYADISNSKQYYWDTLTKKYICFSNTVEGYFEKDESGNMTFYADTVNYEPVNDPHSEEIYYDEINRRYYIYDYSYTLLSGRPDPSQDDYPYDETVDGLYHPNNKEFYTIEYQDVPITHPDIHCIYRDITTYTNYKFGTFLEATAEMMANIDSYNIEEGYLVSGRFYQDFVDEETGEIYTEEIPEYKLDDSTYLFKEESHYYYWVGEYVVATQDEYDIADAVITGVLIDDMSFNQRVITREILVENENKSFTTLYRDIYTNEYRVVEMIYRLATNNEVIEYKQYDENKTYSKDQLVLYNDNVFKSVVDSNINNTPNKEDNTYWEFIELMEAPSAVVALDTGTFIKGELKFNTFYKATHEYIPLEEPDEHTRYEDITKNIIYDWDHHKYIFDSNTLSPDVTYIDTKERIKYYWNPFLRKFIMIETYLYTKIADILYFPLGSGDIIYGEDTNMVARTDPSIKGIYFNNKGLLVENFKTSTISVRIEFKDSAKIYYRLLKMKASNMVSTSPLIINFDGLDEGFSPTAKNMVGFDSEGAFIAGGERLVGINDIWEQYAPYGYFGIDTTFYNQGNYLIQMYFTGHNKSLSYIYTKDIDKEKMKKYIIESFNPADPIEYNGKIENGRFYTLNQSSGQYMETSDAELGVKYTNYDDNQNLYYVDYIDNKLKLYNKNIFNDMNPRFISNNPVPFSTNIEMKQDEEGTWYTKDIDESSETYDQFVIPLTDYQSDTAYIDIDTNNVYYYNQYSSEFKRWDVLELLKAPFDFEFSRNTLYGRNIIRATKYITTYDFALWNDVFVSESPVKVFTYTGLEFGNMVEEGKSYVRFSRKHTDAVQDKGMMFVNGEISKYALDIVDDIGSIRFPIYGISPDDVVEIVIFTECRNTVLDIVVPSSSDIVYIHPSYSLENSIIMDGSATLAYPNTPIDIRGATQYNCDINSYVDLGDGKYKISFIDSYHYGKHLKLVPKNQFRYYRYTAMEDDIYKILLPAQFNYCHEYDRYMVFVNGQKIDKTEYTITIMNQRRPFDQLILYLTTALGTHTETIGDETYIVRDRVDIYYLPEYLKEKYKKPKTTLHGSILLYSNYPKLYALSKYTSMIFVNGYKINPMDITDISMNKLRVDTKYNTINNVTVVEYLDGSEQVAKFLYGMEGSYEIAADTTWNTSEATIHKIVGNVLNSTSIEDQNVKIGIEDLDFNKYLYDKWTLILDTLESSFTGHSPTHNWSSDDYFTSVVDESEYSFRYNEFENGIVFDLSPYMESITLEDNDCFDIRIEYELDNGQYIDTLTLSTNMGSSIISNESSVKFNINGLSGTYVSTEPGTEDEEELVQKTPTITITLSPIEGMEIDDIVRLNITKITFVNVTKHTLTEDHSYDGSICKFYSNGDTIDISNIFNGLMQPLEENTLYKNISDNKYYIYTNTSRTLVAMSSLSTNTIYSNLYNNMEYVYDSSSGSLRQPTESEYESYTNRKTIYYNPSDNKVYLVNDLSSPALRVPFSDELEQYGEEGSYEYSNMYYPGSGNRYLLLTSYPADINLKINGYYYNMITGNRITAKIGNTVTMTETFDSEENIDLECTYSLNVANKDKINISVIENENNPIDYNDGKLFITSITVEIPSITVPESMELINKTIDIDQSIDVLYKDVAEMDINNLREDYKVNFGALKSILYDAVVDYYVQREDVRTGTQFTYDFEVEQWKQDGSDNREITLYPYRDKMLDYNLDRDKEAYDEDVEENMKYIPYKN